MLTVEFGGWHVIGSLTVMNVLSHGGVLIPDPGRKEY